MLHKLCSSELESLPFFSQNNLLNNAKFEGSKNINDDINEWIEIVRLMVIENVWRECAKYIATVNKT